MGDRPEVFDAYESVNGTSDHEDSTGDANGWSHFGRERKAMAGIYGGWAFISRVQVQLEVQDNSPVLDAAGASLGAAADGTSVRAVVLTDAVAEGNAESRKLVSVAACEVLSIVAVVAASLEASLEVRAVAVFVSPSCRTWSRAAEVE